MRVRPVLSLRVKLTLWTLSVFSVVHVTVAVAWLLFRVDAAERSFDDHLKDKAQSLAQVLTNDLEREWTDVELESLARGLSRTRFLERFFVQVRDESGEVLARSSGLEPEDVPLPEGLDLERPRPVLSTLASERGRETPLELRVLSWPFDDRKGRRFTLQVATPVSTASFGRLLEDLFAVSVPIGLIAAGVAAWILAGRAVAPYQRFARAAEAVSPESLEQRIDLAPSDPEVAHLQANWNEALERLESGYRDQERWLTDVSHELKTPIATLLVEAQVQRAAARSRDELLGFAASVEEEMRTLGKLLESFLTLARAQHGRRLVRRERVGVNDLLLESVQHCSRAALQGGVRLIPELGVAGDDTELELEGDPELLSRLLDNLLHNAVRFSPPGREVQVSALPLDGRVRITVRDRGPGLPPEHVERVFERFFTAGQAPQRPAGTGLGLAIAREVSELHGGKIAARNREGGGAEFRVDLPLISRPSRAPSLSGA